MYWHRSRGDALHANLPPLTPFDCVGEGSSCLSWTVSSLPSKNVDVGPDPAFIEGTGKTSLSSVAQDQDHRVCTEQDVHLLFL